MSVRDRFRTVTPYQEPTARRGFTLAELVVALAVMSILMLGLASAILVASHALPDEQRPTSRIVETAWVADQIVEELRSAIWIRERTDTSIELTVADRNSDGAAESIRYAWSGTEGEPLTRQYNGGSAVELLEDLYELELDYEIAQVDEQYPGPPVEGAETELSSHGTVYGDAKSFKVEKDKWPGQYFEPTLPVGTVCWRVTKAFAYMKSDGPENEVTAVQLRLPDENHLPIDTILEEYYLPETSLHDWYEWHEIPFSNVSNLSPDTGLCLVFKNASGGGVSARVRYDDGGGSGGINTKDGGKSWSYFDSLARLYYVYGTASTPGPDQTATRDYVTGVRVMLQAGDNSATRIVTAAQTLNRPGLLSGRWQADFDTDPTLDHNGDGQSDWLIRSGNPFDPATLIDGVWYMDQPDLDTVPDNDFTTLTTIEVRLRSTSAGDTAILWSNVDFANGNFIPIIGAAALFPDGTQTAAVYAGWPLGAPLAWVSGLPSDFVTLRLLIDPDLDTVNIKVNGTDKGTFTYTPYPPTTDPHSTTLTQWGSSAEFDYASVRVSE
jgi:prepilin-type N-terminal cleavage/methylation domain-containing protein